MRFITLLIISVVLLASCSNDDGQLPTQAVLPDPTKTLVPTTLAQQRATELASGNTAQTSENNDSPTEASEPVVPTDIPQDSPTLVPTDEPEDSPTLIPTDEPEDSPTLIPTATSEPVVPTDVPQDSPTLIPTQADSQQATQDDDTSDTPAPTNTPISCNVQDDWDTYTVQRGDNLVAIANRTGSTVEELTQANCLDNPNLVKVGQDLYVPNSPDSPDDEPSATVSATDTSITEQATVSPDLTQPAFSVSINKTFESTIGFGIEFPFNWFVTESTSSTVENAVITSFEYTLGDEIPQNQWTVEMVSITITVFPDETDESLSEWTQSVVSQFQNATNITEVLAPVDFRTDSEIEGQSIDYIASDDTVVRNYYFIINGHQVQFSIGGNFDLAVPIVDSLHITSEA